VAQQAAPDLADPIATDAAAELDRRLALEAAQLEELKRLEEQHRRKTETLSQTRRNLAVGREQLRLLCADARAVGPEDLPDIERRAILKSKLFSALEAAQERLAELAAGQELDAFVAQVKARDPDALIARLDLLEEERKSLQQEQKHLIEEIALQKKELETFAGVSAASAVAENAEGLAGQIQSDVEHYMTLKLASVVLAKAIERYRRINQSPVLEAAGDYFTAMTGGAFEGLRADYDDKGEPVIKAIRPDGKLLTVQDMSDGSRDQLFLSLRLGGLEKYVRKNGPMPFIVDDVLVHFDDDRAAAALGAMARLAEKTQIIFFTHHRHLVELARGSVQDKILKVHQL
jgi:uncharacterized protein YhaN